MLTRRSILSEAQHKEEFLPQIRLHSKRAYRCDFMVIVLNSSALRDVEVYSGICQTLDLAPHLRQQKGNLDILPKQHIIFAVQRLAFFCSRSL